MLPTDFQNNKEDATFTSMITSPLYGSEKVSCPQEEAHILEPISTPLQTQMFYDQC